MSTVYSDQPVLIAEVGAEFDATMDDAATNDAMVVTRIELVERLGAGAGAELFERLDEDFRAGEQVILANVRDARRSFTLARTPGRARIVRAQRPARAGQAVADEEMLLIGLSDLEAVVKANTARFNWADAFAPRPDLPAASEPLTVRSGARGRSVRL